MHTYLCMSVSVSAQVYMYAIVQYACQYATMKACQQASRKVCYYGKILMLVCQYESMLVCIYIIFACKPTWTLKHQQILILTHQPSCTLYASMQHMHMCQHPTKNVCLLMCQHEMMLVHLCIRIYWDTVIFARQPTRTLKHQHIHIVTHQYTCTLCDSIK